MDWVYKIFSSDKIMDRKKLSLPQEDLYFIDLYLPDGSLGNKPLIMKWVLCDFLFIGIVSVPIEVPNKLVRPNKLFWGCVML